RHHFDEVAEQRWLESLTPDLRIERAHRLGVEVLDAERPVAQEPARERRAVEPFACDLLQREVEGVEVFFGQRAAGRHRVAAELLQELGVALADQVERVAQMEARDRAARALDQTVLPEREDER